MLLFLRNHHGRSVPVRHVNILLAHVMLPRADSNGVLCLELLIVVRKQWLCQLPSSCFKSTYITSHPFLKSPLLSLSTETLGKCFEYEIPYNTNLHMCFCSAQSDCSTKLFGLSRCGPGRW